MTFRELLHIEIWSKRTTRRILVLLVVLVFGVAALIVVELKWLTPPERKNATVALVEIDGLQNFAEMTDEDYASHYKEAEIRVHAAEDAAWTDRDNSIAILLSNYLMFTDLRRSQQKHAAELIQSNNEILRKDGLTELQWSISSTPLSEMDSLAMHEALR